jgi:hypothetical protein
MFKMQRYIFGHKAIAIIDLASHRAAFWQTIVVAFVVSFSSSCQHRDQTRIVFETKR